MANPDVLRNAFDTATSWNEWATGLVVAGLIVEFLALLFFGKEMPPKEKVALVAGSIMVAVGVGGEYVFGARAAAAAKSLQQESDEKIAALRGQQEADHKIAAQAAAYAARLGLSVGGLQTFVSQRERAIGATFDQFKSFAADEKKRTEAVIADLSRNKADLQKARDDAVANAAAAMKTVAQANAALTKQQADLAKVRGDLNDLTARAIVTEQAVAPRVLKPAQMNALVAALGPFAGQKVSIGAIPITSESSNLAAQIRAALLEAKVKADFNQGAAEQQVGAVRNVTAVSVEGNAKGAAFAAQFAKTLSGLGIPALGWMLSCRNPSIQGPFCLAN